MHSAILAFLKYDVDNDIELKKDEKVKHLIIKMHQNSNALNKVLVIEYNSMKRSNLTTNL